jgi:hypothetical protein
VAERLGLTLELDERNGRQVENKNVGMKLQANEDEKSRDLASVLFREQGPQPLVTLMG